MFDKLRLIGGNKKEDSALSYRRKDRIDRKLRSTSTHDQSTELFSIKDPYSTRASKLESPQINMGKMI